MGNCTECNWFQATKSDDPTLAGTCDLFSGKITYGAARKGCANWVVCDGCKVELKLPEPIQDPIDQSTIQVNRIYTLKNEKRILIRTGNEKDSEKAWKTFSSQPPEFYRYIHGVTKAMVENWYPKDKIDFNVHYPLNIFELNENDEEGDFLGNAMFIFYSPLSHRPHVAKFGFGIIPGTQGLGIGRLLLRRSLKLVQEFSQIKKVQTEVVCENVPAIALFLKFGFKIEGTRLNSWDVGHKLTDTYILGLDTSKITFK